MSLLVPKVFLNTFCDECFIILLFLFAADKYCPLLESENGIPLLRQLLETDVNDRIKQLCQMVIDQCQHLGKGYIPMEVEEYVEVDDNGDDDDDEDGDENDDGDMQLDG